MAKINSLDSPKLKILMFDFICFYTLIEDIKTDKELTAKYPLIKPRVLSLFKNRKLISKSKNEIQLFDKNLIEKDSFLFTKRDTVILSILRHLRNSIAHYNIKPNPADNSSIVIIDYLDRTKKVLTCYGLLTYRTFVKLLKTIQ